MSDDSKDTAGEAGIPFDYHSHHYRCGHAEGGMADYIRAAIDLGMREFGVSDHGPAYWWPEDHAQPTTQMAKSELPNYVREAGQLKEEFAGRIPVRVGIEADYIEGREDALRALLDGQPFDYALGSVHYVHGVSVFHRPRWREERPAETYREYYRLAEKAARSGLFDTLAHLTVIEAFGPPLSDRMAAELYTPVADAAAEAGCLVEVNTSGYRKMGGDEPFPNRRMLRLLIERGVPITFGSDCHRPWEVGDQRGRAAALLTELGLDPAAPPRRFATRTGRAGAGLLGYARQGGEQTA
jgi:histidinol-phosphatase (PHP family)